MITSSLTGASRLGAALALMFWILLSLPSASLAQSQFEPTKYQFILLPEHCKASLANLDLNRRGLFSWRIPINEERIAYWQDMIGNDWRHIHHYCAGLNRLSAAQEPTNRADARVLNHQAATEIEYSRSRSDERTALWREMTLNYARAKEGMGERDEAVKLLVRLREIDPDNAHTYVALAQTLKRGGKLGEAIAVLEEGLKAAEPKGPMLFYLARYHYDAGNHQRAAELLPAAEKAGMKMDSLRERMGLSQQGAGDIPRPSAPATASSD